MAYYVNVDGIALEHLELLGYYLVDETDQYILLRNKGDDYILCKKDIVKRLRWWVANRNFSPVLDVTLVDAVAEIEQLRAENKRLNGHWVWEEHSRLRSKMEELGIDE
jgi:hypothetical protein